MSAYKKYVFVRIRSYSFLFRQKRNFMSPLQQDANLVWPQKITPKSGSRGMGFCGGEGAGLEDWELVAGGQIRQIRQTRQIRQIMIRQIMIRPIRPIREIRPIRPIRPITDLSNFMWISHIAEITGRADQTFGGFCFKYTGL